MLNCGIKIATTTEGKTGLFRAYGSFSRDGDRCTVCYEQEGDSVTLRFDRSEFRMDRVGETELSVVFRAGERTSIRIGGYGGEGEILVNTTEYSCQPSANGYFISLHYDLLFSENLQTFLLNLYIDTSEEK